MTRTHRRAIAARWQFHFIPPPGDGPAEGGAAYVQALCAALARAGHVVQATPAAPGAVRVVDGLALCSLPASDVAGAVGIIHHATPLAHGDRRAALRDLERQRVPLLRHAVVTSAAVRDRLVAEYGVPLAATTVVCPGVPEAPRSAGSGGPGCTLLTIGALVPRKGHAVLLRALDRLFDLPWRLVDRRRRDA